MGDLSLVVPTAHARPDYVVIGDDFQLSVRATLRFKIYAALSPEWAIFQLKVFVESHGLSRDQVTSIVTGNKRPIYNKQ